MVDEGLQGGVEDRHVFDGSCAVEAVAAVAGDHVGLLAGQPALAEFFLGAGEVLQSFRGLALFAGVAE